MIKFERTTGKRAAMKNLQKLADIMRAADEFYARDTVGGQCYEGYIGWRDDGDQRPTFCAAAAAYAAHEDMTVQNAVATFNRDADEQPSLEDIFYSFGIPDYWILFDIDTDDVALLSEYITLNLNDIQNLSPAEIAARIEALDYEDIADTIEFIED